jgi:hypothetical protein
MDCAALPLLPPNIDNLELVLDARSVDAREPALMT